MFFMQFAITLGFSTISSSFLPLTFLLTGSDLDVLQVLSIVTKRLSCQASRRMFLLFLYATFSPFFSFGFFHDSRNIFPVTHDSSSEVAPDLT